MHFIKQFPTAEIKIVITRLQNVFTLKLSDSKWLRNNIRHLKIPFQSRFNNLFIYF